MISHRWAPASPGFLLLTVALLAAHGCAEETPAPGRDLGEANGEDDAAPEDDSEEDEGASGAQPKEDAGRPAATKLDAGSSGGRADASKPPAVLDAAAVGSDTANDAGTLSDASATDAGGDAASATEQRADLGKGDGKDVITIGDSWMLLATTGIQESLTKASGQPYRKYGRPGTKLLDGVIPGQYATAKRADADIKTVVMTGGGNDIIQNSTLKTDCMQGGAMCDAQVEKIRTALSELWKQMSTDGVQDVIHVMYSGSAGSGVKNRETHNVKMAEVCAAVPAPLHCHLLNTDMLIGPSDMRGDGIHPTDPGYDKIGKAVFELMEKEGMRR
jgi:hypothetical protein